MRRLLPLVLLALAAAALVATATGVAGPGPRRGNGPGGGGGRAFAVHCQFSHRNMDDLIVFPGQADRSHQHTYFGNTTTNASSTVESLRAAGTTSCLRRGDTAAYWV